MHETIVLGLVGSLLFFLKSWFEKLVGYLSTLVLISIETNENHVLDSVSKIKSWSNLDYRWGTRKPRLAAGTHVLWKPIPVVISIHGDPNQPAKLTMTSFIFFKKQLDTLHSQLREPLNGRYCVGTIHGDEFVHRFRTARDPKSLILPARLWDDLVDDIKCFSDRRSQLEKKGLDAKRSFLFYGPPGTGKTSLVQTLAGYFGYYLSICKAVKFKNLQKALVKPDKMENTMLLFDDVDELIKAEDFDLGQFISLLDNLNLNGLVIFTCNDPSALPAKLMRVGRIDRKFKIDYANRSQIEQMFAYFYPEASPALAAKFAAACHGPIAPAVIQEFLMRNTCKDAIRTIGSYLKDLETESKELAKQY